MRHYQIYPFGPEGRLQDCVALDLENDVRAIRRAIDGEFPNGCELWEGYRFVGRFHGPRPMRAPAQPPTAVLVH